MAEQNLDDADDDAVLKQMCCEGVPKRVHRHALAYAGGGPRRPAGGMKNRNADRAGPVAAGKQPIGRPRQPPVDSQDMQECADSIT